MGVIKVASPHAGAIWRERLGSALRTAIACTIIGCTALYGPDPVRLQIQYPSVAYVTAILIVSDATLGTTLRDSWYALCATVLVVPSTVLCLSLVAPSRFTEAGAAVAVTASAFVVSVPECLPLLTKRIAYVQLVIIYVGVVVRGNEAGPVTHPVHIAACTVLGVTGSVLALILPYPRLAVREVKKQSHSYAENASERSNLYLKAFLSDDKSTAYDLICQAEPIAQIGTNILDHINRVQEGAKWETHHRALDFKNMEAPITGMKIALSAISSFPVTIDEEIKTLLQSAQMLKLQHPKPYDDAVTVPERKHTPTLVNISPTRENLPVFFFLSCFELLINANPKPESLDAQKVNIAKKTRVEKIVGQSITERVVFALKCSIALGLAVLLGMFFDKKNGYWSGLTIAISFVEGRLPIFTVANNRVKGTAIGSVYGVLGSCLLHQVAELRFIILLPWIVFTSMLHHSQMYGESGGIAAVISALLILGRKNYGPPKQFAIARLTEVSIGLFCMVLLEITLQPVRAATVVKLQVSQCLGTLDECLNHIACPKENIRKMKSDLNGLRNRIKDARSEPSFWFLPFKASCYNNARERLSKMVEKCIKEIIRCENPGLMINYKNDIANAPVQITK
ncbi:putative para-hydroxybenzoic acid efflux pump subunit AaeB/fusaric acid resistance protein [Helianthus annuus]|nr:putative para-hydroxybenzoic acid efflux pump subunit AaeB/fusaric acid resistance protein [Helianthus annuus]